MMIQPDDFYLSAAKKSIREEIRQKIRALSKLERVAQEEAIIDQLNQWLVTMATAKDSLILAFWPTLIEEPDFRPWLQTLESVGVSFALPRLEWATGTLSFHRVCKPGADLEIAPSGLAQPRKALELVLPDQAVAILVPGLAFDRRGGRLGRGAGFYDRTLALIGKEIPRLGVGLESQVIPKVPMECWDQRLDGLILPTGIDIFKKDQDQ